MHTHRLYDNKPQQHKMKVSTQHTPSIFVPTNSVIKTCTRMADIIILYPMYSHHNLAQPGVFDNTSLVDNFDQA